MKNKRIPVVAAALALVLLGGCSLMSRSYVSVEPYRQSGDRVDQGITAVSSYQEVRSALIQMIEDAVDSRTLSLVDFNSNQVETNLELAVRSVLTGTPLGAYAVEDITFDLGSTGGVPAVMMTVHYNHNRGQLRSLRQVNGMDAAINLLTGALGRLDSDLVVQVSGYRDMDLVQLVENYATKNPDLVMEIPQLTVTTYPDYGTNRVLEVKFTYQTSRESLKTMQSYVRPMFGAAAMFVAGEEDQGVKYSRIYAFLMETADFELETSITPTYSLLRHSVGDSKAVATVYASMCRRAGLECDIVTGTREGEPWSWNLICEDGQYYHVDPVSSYLSGGFTKGLDEDMSGYVWDYAAHPQCVLPEQTEGEEPGQPEQTQGTEPTQAPTEPQTSQTEPIQEDTEPEN